MKRAFRILIVIGMAAFLALAPPWLLRGLEREGYRAFLEKPEPAWRGRIELWHIAGFRVYQGSVTDYLTERADAYCKKHKGVHIDVVGLTQEQLAERLMRGLTPDAYSFPAGLLYPERLAALPEMENWPAFIGNLQPARQGERAYAVPYLLSGYFLLGNVQLLAKYGFELPETADAAFLQSALDLPEKTPQLSMPAVQAARLGLTGALAEADAFKAGKCMLAVLDARAFGDILRGGGENLLAEAIPFPDFTDEAMYIGGAAEATPEQLTALAGFIEFLLSEKEQQRLSTLGAMPVIATAGKTAYADERLVEWQKAYAAPVVPQPFLWERHRAALMEEARNALTGDAAAQAAFFERFKVVESGKL